MIIHGPLAALISPFYLQVQSEKSHKKSEDNEEERRMATVVREAGDLKVVFNLQQVSKVMVLHAINPN